MRAAAPPCPTNTSVIGRVWFVHVRSGLWEEGDAEEEAEEEEEEEEEDRMQ